MQTLKLIPLALLLFGLAVAPGTAQAAYDNITYSAAGSIVLTGPNPDITLTVSNNSTANNIVVGSQTVTIILERDATDASSITLTSADRYTLNNDGGFSATCGSSSSSLTLTGPSSVGTSTVIVSPSLTPCSTTSGGGGGGGGSTYVAPTTTTTDTTEEETAAEEQEPAAQEEAAAQEPAAEEPAETVTEDLGLVEVPAVSATPTVEELQAAITAILTNIQVLQAELAKLEPSAPAGVPPECSGVSFTRGLTSGSTGQDVKCLQALLNQSSATQVASSGVGSAGNETSYFGGLSADAVGRFQVKEGIISDASHPAYGYVGPKTRAKLNELLGK